jgi:hypothetical protein
MVPPTGETHLGAKTGAPALAAEAHNGAARFHEGLQPQAGAPAPAAEPREDATPLGAPQPEAGGAAAAAAGAPAPAAEAHDDADLSHLAPVQRRNILQNRQKAAVAKADAMCQPIRTFMRQGKRVKVFDKHRLLEDMPKGWTLEQVDRHGKGSSVRMSDNYWIEPGTEKRFDSRRKVRAHLDPDSEEAAIITARQQDRASWTVALESEGLVPELKRARIVGADDDVSTTLEALVRTVERVHAHRPAARTSRNAPSSEAVARRIESIVVEGPSAFMAFALARCAQFEATEPELEPDELAGRLASLWREQPAAERARYELIAREQREQTSASLRCKAAERPQRMAEARQRLLHASSD